MAIEILENGNVSDTFEITQNGFSFKDAIVMDAIEYQSFGEQKIAAMKQARFDAWYAIITAISEE